jgi:uncharacterized SAM-binding protein YcdF (DUF218 family)
MVFFINNGKMKTNAQLIIIALLGLMFNSCALHGVLENQYKKVAHGQTYDAIIVPGTPIGEKGLESIFIARMRWAKYLYDNNIARNIIFSGGAVHTPYVEALAMKIYADSMGIPSKHTFAETKAEHSTENVYFGMKMAQKLGFKKIALSTDVFQTIFLHSFIQRKCKGVVSIPIVFKTVFKGKNQIDPLPEADLTAAQIDENIFIPLKERETFSQRYNGTLGLKINYVETENIIDPTSQACDSVGSGSY